jgi:hypothetical protein
MPHAYLRESTVARARIHDLSHHDSVDVMNVGDLHGGDPYCEWDEIRGLAAWLAAKPNRYAVITGDVFSTAVKGSVSLHLGEPEMPTKDARHLLANILRPVADRVLAAVSGNHDDRQARDTGEDSVDALCCEIGIPYYPEGEAFVGIDVGRWAHNTVRVQPVRYCGYITHGNAGGRLPGAKANALVAMRSIVHNADWYANGHGHTPLIIPEVAWRFSSHGGDVRAQQQVFISCGATLRRGGYPVRKSFPALSRVFPFITLHGGHKHMTAVAEVG